MAPSSIPDTRPLQAPQGVHLLLCVGLPTAFVMLSTFWLTGVGPLRWEWVVNLVYSLLMFFWAGWKQRTKQGILVRVWLWTVVGLLAYGVQSLVEGQLWPQLFRLDAVHTLWFLAGFVQAQLSALWSSQLASRARLFQLIEGLPEGTILEDRVRSFQLDADFSSGNQAVLAASLASMAAVAVTLASVSTHGQGGLQLGLLAGFLLVVTLTGVLFRTYRREMTTLVYGYRMTWTDKLKPLAWALLLALVAAGISWLMMGLGGPWFNWQVLDFARQQDIPTPPTSTAPERPTLPAYQGSLKAAVFLTLLAQMFGFQNVTWLLTTFLQVLVWVWPLGIGAFLLWPLVKWVASGGRETRGLLPRWLGLLAGQWRSFWSAWGQWRARKTSTEGGQALGPESVREWIRSFMRGVPEGHRAPIAEVVQAFLQLTRWAQPLVAYQHGQTTREFLMALRAAYPRGAASLASISEKIDRELFSLHGLSEADRLQLLEQIRLLVSQPAVHDDSAGVS